MAVTGSTGFIGVSDGGTNLVSVPGTRVDSARLRWKGKTTSDRWEGYSQGTMLADFPAPPLGYSVTGGLAEFAVTINAGWSGAFGSVSVSASGGSKSIDYNLGPYVIQRFNVSVPCNGTGTAQGGYSIQGSGGASNPVTTATTEARRDWLTTNPRVTIGGQQIVGPASLVDGAISGWYDIPAGALVGGNNEVPNNIEGSGLGYLEIEYTYQPYPPSPERLWPENIGIIEDRTPGFEMTLNAAENSDSEFYHGQLILSQSPTFASSVVVDSSTSQVGWEYWDGSAWDDLPSIGVPSGTKVRYIPSSPMSLGVWYWKALTRDEWGVGIQSSSWRFRMVLSVDALEGYSLAVASTVYPCLDLEVNLACNGKLGTIRFVLSNLPDSEGLRNNDLINYGDTVNVSIYDETGHEAQYLGRVWQKTPGDTTLEVIASMGDKILADRILKTDYLSEDLGTALAGAVDTYCAPILSTGIPDPIGIVVNLPLSGKQVLAMFLEAMRIWARRFWVETDVTDWVAHVVDPSALSMAGILVRHGGDDDAG